VLSGVKSGIKTISEICFSMGCFLLGMLLYMDNTWFLLNSYVQSVGFYFQWVIQVRVERSEFSLTAVQNLPPE
jgi:choline-glycine betaine transporter